MKLRNRLYMALGLLILISGLIMLINPSYTKSTGALLKGILTLSLGVILINHWSSISYTWICEVCGEVRDLSFIENILYINIGINRKYFKCKECGIKRIFNGKYKY